MSHCSLCGAGLPGAQRLHQAEISVCKSCGTAVIELVSNPPKRGAHKNPPTPLRRYRRRSIFSRLWAFS